MAAAAKASVDPYQGYKFALDEEIKKANDDRVYFRNRGKTMYKMKDFLYGENETGEDVVDMNLREMEDKHERAGLEAMKRVMEQGHLRKEIFEEGGVPPLLMNQLAAEMYNKEPLFEDMQTDACKRLLPDTKLMHDLCSDFESEDEFETKEANDFLLQCRDKRNLCDFVVTHDKQDHILHDLMFLHLDEFEYWKKKQGDSTPVKYLRTVPDRYQENFSIDCYDVEDLSKIVKDPSNFNLYMAYGIRYIGSSAFANSQYEMPDSYVGTWILPSTVLSIGDNCFYRFKGFNELDLSRTQIDVIEDGCFQESEFQAITLPRGIKKIKKEAFFGCNFLEHVNLEDTQVTEIWFGAFANCIFRTIEFPATLQNIAKNSFKHCQNLRVVDLAKTNVTEIGLGAFAECNALEEVVLPETLKVIGPAAFIECINLKKINLHDTKIDKLYTQTFRNCTSMTVLQLPDTLTMISGGLEHTGLKEIVMPKSVTDVFHACFNNMPNLEVAVFENENDFFVDYNIDSRRINFENCPSLKRIIRRNKPITGGFLSKLNLENHPDVEITSD